MEKEAFEEENIQVGQGFPAKKIGRNWRIHKERLDAWACDFAS